MRCRARGGRTKTGELGGQEEAGGEEGSSGEGSVAAAVFCVPLFSACLTAEEREEGLEHKDIRLNLCLVK